MKAMGMGKGDNPLIPQDSRRDRPQMPQAMRVHRPPQRREIEHLEAHGHHDPGDRQARPHGPRALAAHVLVVAVPAPQQVLHDADGHVRRHVIAVVPPVHLQV